MQLGTLHIKERCPLMIPNLMVALSLHSMTTTSRSHGTLHTWLPIHVEISAEHPVVYANYAWSNFFNNCNLHVSSLLVSNMLVGYP